MENGSDDWTSPLPQSVPTGRAEPSPFTPSFMPVVMLSILFNTAPSKCDEAIENDPKLNWLVTPHWLISKSAWPQYLLPYQANVLIMFMVET